MLEASRCIDREDNIIVSYSTLIESNEIYNVKLVHIFNKWITKLYPRLFQRSFIPDKCNNKFYDKCKRK